MLIVLVATFARLWNIGVSEYRFDEAQVSGMAFDVLAGHPSSVGPPASIGIPVPPTMNYILAIPYRFTSDPLTVTTIIAVWNVVGCLLLWFLCRRYLAPGAAFAATLIYAVTPWALFYSRKIWHMCFATPFLLVGLLLGFRGFHDGKRWAQVLCLPMLMIVVQIHYSAIGLLPLYLWFLWTGRKRIVWWAVGLSVLLSLALWIPFTSVLPQVVTAITHFAHSDSQRGLSLNLEGFAYLEQFATGSGLDLKLAGDGAAALRAATGWTPIWGIALGLLTLAGIPLIIRLHRRVAIFVLLWALLLALVVAPGWLEVYDHYLILALPALCVLAGVAVEAVAALKFGAFPLGRWAALIGLVVVLLGQFGWWDRLLDYLDHHGGRRLWHAAALYGVQRAPTSPRRMTC